MSPASAPHFNTANAVDYGLIALYFAVVIWIGLYSARKSRTTAAYFRGGGKIPWLLAGLSNFVSGFSAFLFVASAGFTYRNGLGAVIIIALPAPAFLLGAFTFAKYWRRARIGSPMEFLRRRFSPSTTYFYSVVTLLPTLVGIGLGLYIVCFFVSSVLGFAGREIAFAGLTLNGTEISLLILGAVVIFYTTIGGLWAAVLSDTVQMIILGVMSLLILPLTFVHLGQGGGFFAGVARLWREAPPHYFGFPHETGEPLFILACIILEFVNYNAGWALVQRYHSVVDERSARKMALLCAGLVLVGPAVWVVPAMAARVLFPDLHALWPGLAAPEEASFVSLALLLLPHGMLGFVVSAILSSAIGKANDAFNWLAVTVTHDLYVPWRRWRTGADPTDRRQMRATYVAMVLMGMTSVALAWFIPRFGGVWRFSINYTTLWTMLQIPVFLGMIYRRTPWWSAIAACAAAPAVVAVLMVLGIWEDHAFVRNVLVETAVVLVVFFGSARWYRDDDPRSAGARELDANLQRPVLADERAAVAGSLRVYGLVGAASMVFGLALLGCAFLPSGARTSPAINLIGGLILAPLGAWLWRIGRRHAAASGDETVLTNPGEVGN